MIPVKPIDATWTDEQWQAIYEDNKNIIVSAGAGSGKTAVLTQRVIRKLKDGVKVNRLLILTFTKAAAGEMQDRIRDKIKKDPSLKENLNLLDQAYITTFDSFALSVVKKYHYLLNLSPNISIIDSSIISMEKENIIENIFLEYYKERNPKFLNLIDAFCIKDDSDIKNYFLTISNKLDLLSNKEEYLSNYIKNNFSDQKLNRDIEDYTNLIKEKIEKINELVKEISFIDAEFALKLKDSLEIMQEVDDYDDLITKLNVKLPNAPRGSEEELKAKKKEITETLNEINELANYASKEEIKETILKTKPIIEIMIEIIQKLTERTMKFKKDHNSYEFNDIAILAIKIVKDFSIAREELKELFQEIMIDEYQDTNDLQEEFINQIANNNTYMVGDIKQSIYRFRNANPYIFKNKYDTYANSTKDLKIDLNKNFRSRKEVINSINTIFNLVMNDRIGGADYLSSHQMIYGNEAYLKETPNHSNDMEIYQYEYSKDTIYTMEEVEAFIIARDIKEKIENNYQVFDKKTSLLRPAKFEDFAIIMDRSTFFDLYKKIFNYFSIPVTLLKDEKMNEETDVLILNNLIKLIIKIRKNEMDTEWKYLFTSIERSFLFEKKDNEIFDFFEKKNFKESVLYKKCLNISEHLSNKSIHEILDIIIKEFNYYEKYITIGNIEAGIVKLTKLRETALNLEELGYTIEGFSNYLESILKKGYKIEYSVKETNASSVKIMTIHKSKGLEYPVCYFSGLYKEFNISDIKERFLVDKKLGIITPYFDEGIEKTIYKDLLKRNYIEEEISEKIRLFYVALTRAREKIILINPMSEKLNDISNETTLKDSLKLSYRTLADIVNSCYFRIKNNYITKNIKDLQLTKNYNLPKEITLNEKIESINETFEVEEINIEKQELENSSFSKKIERLITKEEKEKMEFGTLIHEYLEYIDLKNPNLSIIDNKFIKERIEIFLNQEFLKNIDTATIYQEYEFINNQKTKSEHGIIDLMLEYNDHIDIIDYKLKNIDDDSYQKQLKGYKNYINTITKKEVHIYLYSILEGIFSKIE